MLTEIAAFGLRLARPARGSRCFRNPRHPGPARDSRHPGLGLAVWHGAWGDLQKFHQAHAESWLGPWLPGAQPVVWRLSRLPLAVREAPPARRRSKEAHDQPEQHQATNPHPGTAAGELHKPIRLLACERKPGHYPRRVVHRAALVCFGWQPLDRAALRFPHRPSCERPGQARDASSLDESPRMNRSWRLRCPAMLCLETQG